ncbi:hypothetical protein [Bacillus sp. FJAT-27245]|nr:hypothetical protein [Bacillus sp. FJAT-27245]
MSGDGGDFLIWISLIAVLFIVNYLAITLYSKKKTSFSGLAY